MKTTKKDFELFRAEFRRWQQGLGLTDFRCTFRHQPADGCFGSIRCDHVGKCATVVFASNIPDVDRDAYSPIRTARHEALELLLARLENIACCRYCFPDDISEERHAVIRRLENLFDENAAKP